MAPDPTPGPDAFDRSRVHRGGVRQACVALEQAIARPLVRDPGDWADETGARVAELLDAFRSHVVASEGPTGLLQEIVSAAPRLAHAVEGVKREHRAITVELENLSSSVDKVDRPDAISDVRDLALHTLQHIASHRHRGADLIYEAYSVDIEGGE